MPIYEVKIDNNLIFDLDVEPNHVMLERKEFNKLKKKDPILIVNPCDLTYMDNLSDSSSQSELENLKSNIFHNM